MILILFLLTALVGGTGAPLVKFALTQFPPITMVFLRALLAAVLIYPFVFRKVSFKKQGIKYLICANILFAINWLLFSLGVAQTSVIMAQIMYVPTAIIVAAIGYIFLKEKINKEQIFGLILTISGISFLIASSINQQGVLSFGSPIGNLLIAFGMLAWASYLVISRKISKEFPPEAITFFNFLITIPIALILIPLEKSPLPSSVTFVSVVALLSIVFVSSIGFFILIQLLIKHTSAFIASLAIYPMTIFATIAGVVFYGEKITMNFLIGAAFVLFGVFIATSYKFARKYIKI